MCIFGKHKKQAKQTELSNSNQLKNVATVSPREVLLNGNVLKLTEVPNICPHCNKKLGFRAIFACQGHEISNIFNYGVIDLVIFQCAECREIVVGRYTDNGHFLVLHNNKEKSHFYPSSSFHPTELNKYITEHFSNFIEIYNEAEKAEYYGCVNIAGAGYRKATEFLVRDFATLCHPEKEKIIKSKEFATRKVVQDFLKEFPMLAEAANASLELGNDETHYTKQYDTNGLADLKKFIEITCKEVEARFVLKDFQKTQQAKNKEQRNETNN